MDWVLLSEGVVGVGLAFWLSRKNNVSLLKSDNMNERDDRKESIYSWYLS